jgi:hypothetical protein
VQIRHFLVFPVQSSILVTEITQKIKAVICVQQKGGLIMGSILAILREAVKEMPELRVVWGVVAVAAAPLVILALSKNNPRVAILSVVLGLAAVILISAFVARNGRSNVKTPWENILMIWVFVLCLCASMIMSVTAYAGWGPEGWCNVVGCPKKIPEDKVEPQPPVIETAKPKEKISQVFKISDGSNDCDVNENKSVEMCLPVGSTVTSVGPIVTMSANGGSAVGTINPKPGQTNCYVADYLLKGNGYDSVFGIKNCRGRGWLEADVTVYGER